MEIRELQRELACLTVNVFYCEDVKNVSVSGYQSVSVTAEAYRVTDRGGRRLVGSGHTSVIHGQGSTFAFERGGGLVRIWLPPGEDLCRLSLRLGLDAHYYTMAPVRFASGEIARDASIISDSAPQHFVLGQEYGAGQRAATCVASVSYRAADSCNPAVRMPPVAHVSYDAPPEATAEPIAAELAEFADDAEPTLTATAVFASAASLESDDVAVVDLR